MSIALISQQNASLSTNMSSAAASLTSSGTSATIASNNAAALQQHEAEIGSDIPGIESDSGSSPDISKPLKSLTEPQKRYRILPNQNYYVPPIKQRKVRKRKRTMRLSRLSKPSRQGQATRSSRANLRKPTTLRPPSTAILAPCWT